jgi:AbrB family looped-hinge helix DNA binding protein
MATLVDTRAVITIGPKGRFVLPAKLRTALGVTEGDSLIATLKGDSVVLETRNQIREQIWAGAPKQGHLDADASIARFQEHDCEIMMENLENRSAVHPNPEEGKKLLELLGL